MLRNSVGSRGRPVPETLAMAAYRTGADSFSPVRLTRVPVGRAAPVAARRSNAAAAGSTAVPAASPPGPWPPACADHPE